MKLLVARKELTGFLLLAPGMFLYARIVLDNVVDLINIEEIRRELRALPEDLDAA